MIGRASLISLSLTLFSFAALAAEDMHGSGHGDTGHGGSTSGLPQLDISSFPSQIFWLGIAFTILYVAFSSKILPGMAANLENRDQTIQNDLTTAERLTGEAADFKQSFQEGLLKARQEATQMIADLDIKMRKDHEKKIADFLKKTEEQISETRQRLEKSTATSMKDIEKHIEEAALIAAKNIAGIDTDGKAVKAALKAVNSNIKMEAA